jgi:hypothetical protein
MEDGRRRRKWVDSIKMTLWEAVRMGGKFKHFTFLSGEGISGVQPWGSGTTVLRGKSRTTQHRQQCFYNGEKNEKMAMNDELGRMGKQEIIVCLKAWRLLHNSRARAEEDKADP